MTRRLVLAMTTLAGLVAIALAIPLASIAATNVRSAFIAQLEIERLGGIPLADLTMARLLEA